MGLPRARVLVATLLPSAFAAVLSLAWPLPGARAEVHRCTNPDGESVYTDKRCVDIGALDRLPRTTSAPAGTSRLYRSGCSRTLQDLVYELTSAIDSRDVNRLAGIYDWNGASTANAYRIMDRLGAIVQRPLVDVLPVVPPAPDEYGTIVDGEYYPPPALRRAPTGLRLEQVLVGTATPSRTVFGLRRNLGCWWVRL